LASSRCSGKPERPYGDGSAQSGPLSSDTESAALLVAENQSVNATNASLLEHLETLTEERVERVTDSPPIPNARCDQVQFALTVPTVLDRFIQQAVMQALQRSWDGTFSEHSYGFRPNGSAHQAVAKAQQYQAEGYRWVVDLDLEKFFDRVNHDRLLAKIAERVSDKRLLKLIRAFLASRSNGERAGESG